MKKFYYLPLLLIVVSCSNDPEDLKNFETTPISLSLIVTQDNVPADNYTYAEITATVEGRPNSNDMIVFTTDKGTFSGGTSTYSATINSDNSVTVKLKHDRSDVARVTATIYGRTAEAFATFAPAYPSQLLLSPQSLSLAPEFTSVTIINTQLLRLTGSVTAGLSIQYHDSTDVPNGSSIGIFTASTLSDANGHAQVYYRLTDTSYHGFVYLKGRVNTPTGPVLGQNVVFIE